MIDVKSLTTRLLSRQRAEQRAREMDGRELVAAVLDDKAIDESVVLDQLDRLGWTPEWLEHEVELLAKRRQMESIARGEPELRRRKAELEAQAQKLADDFLEAEKQFRAAGEANRIILEGISLELAQIERIKRQLSATAPSAVQEATAAAASDLAGLNFQIQGLRDRLSTTRGQFVDRRGDIKPTIHGERAGLKARLRSVSKDKPLRWEQKAAELEGGLRRLDAEETAAKSQLAELEARRAEVEKKYVELRKLECIA